jgi:predicted N-acetyltransferase YhbS
MPSAPPEPKPRGGEAETIVFRRLAPADAAEAAAVIRAAFSAQPQETDPPSSALGETVATVAAKIEAGGGFCAIVGAVMVGAALWQEKDGALHIGRVSVLPGWRGRGIARALIERGEGEARDRGLTRLSLNVRLALDGNQRLFAACGFRRIAVASHPGYTKPTFAIMEKPVD